MRARSLMPTYSIRFPSKLWTALNEQGIFTNAPPRVRAAFEAAEQRPTGNGHSHFITGSSIEVDAVRAHFRRLVKHMRSAYEKHRNNHRSGHGDLKASQFGYYGLAALERYAAQPLKRVRSKGNH